MDALVARRGRDLRGREADALVDDVHAGVARARRRSARRRWSARRARACRRGSSSRRPSASRTRSTSSRNAAERRRRRRPRPRRRRSGARYSPNTSRSAPAHSPVVHARAGGGDRRRHDVLVARRRPRRSSAERGLDAPRCRAARATRSTASRCSASTPGSTVRMPPSRAGQRRRLGLGEAVDADDDLLAGLDARACRSRCDSTSAAFMYVDGLDRAAALATHAPSRLARASSELADEPVHRRLRALEDVGVLEQVGLVGQHLLDAQRPLLVPRARAARAPRSRPGSCTARARASRPSVTAERLEHDPLHVVLGLGLGEPERVHLHAVAEAQQLARR